MGEVFAGRYELVDLIGEGGMGSVWRVWDSRENRLVAAKVLRQSDAVSLLRFVREQAVRVAHPHVLTPLGWAGEDDRVLFTMPVVDGGSVSTLVGDHGPLPPRFAAELLRQLLDALVAVHGAGIVHRDIKPANLLLRATGAGRPHLYLTDFGIAVDLEGPRFTRTGGPSGTPGYIAPETRAGAEPDPRSDLYAVGRVALTMLAGERLPVDTVPACPPGVPESLWQWAARLAAPDPDDRPPSAAQAATALDDPALAWAPGAAGEVEVLRQVADVPGRAQLVAEDDATVVRTPAAAAPVTAAPRPTDTSPRGTEPPRRTALAGAAVVTLLAVSGLLAWSPWSGAPSEPRPTSSLASPTPTPSVGTTAPTGSPSPSGTATPSSTPGGVGVGTVVSRVGQPCEFADVGVREVTTGGEPVVCRLRDDGGYAWDPPPG